MKFISQKKEEKFGVKSGNITPVNPLETLTGETGNFDRREQDMKTGSVFRTITNDTLPGGPVERTIEYIAPFDKCNREKDYQEVWSNLERM